MKNLILATAIAFLASAAHAEKIIAQVPEVDAVIKTVSLTDKGLVEILKQDGSQASLQLSPSNTRSLVGNAVSLETAEIVTDFRQVVCKMMVMQFSVHVLLVADKNGELVTALSSSSCALSEYTHPTMPYLLKNAQDLEAQLLLIAHQIASN